MPYLTVSCKLSKLLCNFFFFTRYNNEIEKQTQFKVVNANTFYTHIHTLSKETMEPDFLPVVLPSNYENLRTTFLNIWPWI